MKLKGRHFGRLEVIGPGRRPKYVLCECECGQQKEIRATSLTRTKCPTRSCGCYQREVASRVGTKDVAANSAPSIAVNMRHNTNFQVIENHNLPKNNSSGCKGVSWNARRGKWEAYISVHGKRINLGRHDNYLDAVEARKQGELDYHVPLIDKKREEQNDGIKSCQLS